MVRPVLGGRLCSVGPSSDAVAALMYPFSSERDAARLPPVSGFDAVPPRPGHGQQPAVVRCFRQPPAPFFPFRPLPSGAAAVTRFRVDAWLTALAVTIDPGRSTKQLTRLSFTWRTLRLPRPWNKCGKRVAAV